MRPDRKGGRLCPHWCSFFRTSGCRGGSASALWCFSHWLRPPRRPLRRFGARLVPVGGGFNRWSEPPSPPLSFPLSPLGRTIESVLISMLQHHRGALPEPALSFQHHRRIANAIRNPASVTLQPEGLTERSRTVERRRGATSDTPGQLAASRRFLGGAGRRPPARSSPRFPLCRWLPWGISQCSSWRLALPPATTPPRRRAHSSRCPAATTTTRWIRLHTGRQSTSSCEP